MPVPGEVDIVIGAELMEAGRAMQRGLVSPDRTTLIASTHRAYAVSEKSAPGDGAGDPAKVYEAAHARRPSSSSPSTWRRSPRRRRASSPQRCSAPWRHPARCRSRAQAYEATIRAAGLGVEASLRAFDRAYEAAVAEQRSPRPPRRPAPAPALKRFPELQPIGDAGFDALVERARSVSRAGARHGRGRPRARRRLPGCRLWRANISISWSPLPTSRAAADADYPLTRAAAKQIARAMAYDDVIRVADLKTRGSRFARVRTEVAGRGPTRSSMRPSSCIRAWRKCAAPCRPGSASGSRRARV